MHSDTPKILGLWVWGLGFGVSGNLALSTFPPQKNENNFRQIGLVHS
jgi:hypothetical protein